MGTGLRQRLLAVTLLPALALACALPVAADAHGRKHSGAARRHDGGTAPAPLVVVRGVVTSAPAPGSDSFTATAYVAAPGHLFPLRGDGHSRRGGIRARDAGRGDAGGDQPGAGDRPPGFAAPAGGTPNTVITTDAGTSVTIDGQAATLGSLAVGDVFSATYAGTPSQALSSLTTAPAISLAAWAPAGGRVLYAFVGTVASTAGGTITVNVTSSIPTGLFAGADNFTVGPQTIVLGNSGSSLFGSFANIGRGDVVAGGLIGPAGETASAAESAPLQVLVDFPSASSGTTASLRRTERRAIRLLRRERARLSRHHKKQHRNHGK